MKHPILVTGGGGTLGREVVSRVLEAGADVRVLSRHPGDLLGVAAYAVDLRGGEGLEAALDGVGTIVHCATSLGRGDVAAARTLLDASARAGAPHLVYVSIVGVDRIPLGYYKVKLAVEELIEGSGLPWTILRTTQFHDLLAGLFSAQRRLPVTVAPALRVQPIDKREVADRLAELAAGSAAGRVPDMGGPEVREVRDLARAWLRARGRRRAVLPLRVPGRTFAAFRRGANLAPDHADGRITFEQFLEGVR